MKKPVLIITGVIVALGIGALIYRRRLIKRDDVLNITLKNVDFQNKKLNYEITRNGKFVSSGSKTWSPAMDKNISGGISDGKNEYKQIQLGNKFVFTGLSNGKQQYKVTVDFDNKKIVRE